jgi:hypothetical protein
MAESHMTELGRSAAAALLIVSVLWTGAIAATPYVVSHGSIDVGIGRAAGIVYAAGSVICHQRSERSSHPWGVQFPVCARCFGIYLAGPFGIAIVLVTRRRRQALSRGEDAARANWQRLVLLACVPTALTLIWEWTTGDMTPGPVRALAGGALGGPVAALLAAVAVGELR